MEGSWGGPFVYEHITSHHIQYTCLANAGTICIVCFITCPAAT